MRRFFARTLGMPQRLSHQEAVGGNAQAGVVMEPLPAPAFVVPESDFLLEVLIIALNAPAHRRPGWSLGHCPQRPAVALWRRIGLGYKLKTKPAPVKQESSTKLPMGRFS